MFEALVLLLPRLVLADAVVAAAAAGVVAMVAEGV